MGIYSNNDKTFIIINGYPGSGKDLFVKYAQEIIEEITNRSNFSNKIYVHNLSTIDPAKDILKQMGWNGEKTPEMRDALAEMKVFMDKYFNMSEEYIFKEAEKLSTGGDKYYHPHIFFIHIREPEKIKLMKDVLRGRYPKSRVLTLFVRNNTNVIDYNIQNQSDHNVDQYQYDIYVDNPKDTKGLNKVESFIKYRDEVWRTIIFCILPEEFKNALTSKLDTPKTETVHKVDDKDVISIKITSDNNKTGLW